MTPYRACAAPRAELIEADVVRFGVRMRRARRLRRAGVVTTLAALWVGLVVSVHGLGRGSPPPTARRAEVGYLPVQVLQVTPGMCAPGQHDRGETRFALAVEGLDECPWF
jgi:hypothetical protein